MTPMNYDYSVHGWWGGPADEAPSATGAKFLETIDSLSGIDPIFANWEVIRNWRLVEDRQPRQIPLAAARERIVEVVKSGIVLDDFGELSPREGYSVCATAGARGPRHVAFVARTGNQHCELSFGEHYLASDLSIVTYPLFKAALLAISTVWDVQWAYANARRNEFVEVATDIAPGVPGFRIDAAPQVPIDPTFPESMFAVPWIIYLSAKHAAGVRVGDEIQSEHTPDGGLVMSATTDRLDPTNPQHVRAARILAETLIACRSGR